MPNILEGLLQGTGQASGGSDNAFSLQDLLESQLGGYYKGADKAMKEMGEQQVTEAIQQGVPAKEIMAGLIKMASPKSALQQGSVSQDQQGNINIQKEGWGRQVLQNILPAFFGTNDVNRDLEQLQAASQIQRQQSGTDPSLERYRNAMSGLAEKQLERQENKADTELVYRDPITGEEVDEETAKKDTKEGLGVYQVNQKIVTRSGVQEKSLNKVPDLTQEEKKYVNDARIMGQSLTTLETGFDALYDKFGKANWQTFQMEKIPYILTQDQDVQGLKSELIYLKAAIPFLRGGKQLTITEAKRVDAMLNPFGKNKETYKKDIRRFQDEFMYGADIMKFGVNAKLMRRLTEGHIKKQEKISKIEKLGFDSNRYELVEE